MPASTLGNFLRAIGKDSSVSAISALNEEDAKRRIVLRILGLLGWDVYGDEIKQEYGVGERRVDYALQVNGENKVFIEAKKPGENLDRHQEQLLDYSFDEKVALAVLTNGISWWFYLVTMKDCDWNDLRLYNLDILKQEENVVDILDRLLSRENVGSGKAVQHAESILERCQKEKAFRENLSKSWNRIIKDCDCYSLLVELLKETTEEICGFGLEEADVEKIPQFIHSHREKWILSPEQQGIDPLPTKQSNAKTGNQTKGQMQIGDVHCEFRNSLEILVNTANWLIDEGELKPSDRPVDVSRGDKRVLIDRKPKHPSGKDFVTPRKLKNGLYIECHASRKSAIEYSKRLLEECEYNREMLRVS